MAAVFGRGKYALEMRVILVCLFSSTIIIYSSKYCLGRLNPIQQSDRIMYVASTGARRDSRGDRMNYGVLHVAIAHMMMTRHWLTTGTIQRM